MSNIKNINNQERIIAAAYKVKPEFECDNRIVYKHADIRKECDLADDIYRIRIARHHAEIIHVFRDEIDINTDGFYTSYGRYVDRREAAKIALSCGQCHTPLIMGDKLDSSDIFE